MTNKLFLSIILLFMFVINIQTVQGNEIISSALEKTVMIISLDQYNQPLGIGSGFLIGENGEIATNYHVVEGASSAIIKFVNKKEKYKAKFILQKNEKYDIAIIKIDLRQPPLSTGDDRLSKIGQKIYAIGNPEGLEGTVSEGIISGFRKINEDFRLMQITAPISPGSSGGPVINEKGEVIGIASASILLAQNLNFAIPSKKVIEIFEGKKLNLPFKKNNLPLVKDKLVPKKAADIDLVKVQNIKRETWYSGGSGSISLSIKNNYRRDIKNIKILIAWYDGFPLDLFDKNKGIKDLDVEPIHFSAILVKDIIPSKLAKTIIKKDVEGIGILPDINWAYSRIIDYEILPNSGSITFQ